jgi:hypothetical protein
MTLVRKGLLTARGYHLLYTASLCVPFVVGFARAHKVMFALMPTAYGLLGVRRRLGRAPQWKYLIWGPVLLARVLAGDHALLRV